jgi:hypothetical protein
MGNLVLITEMEKNSSSHERQATSDEIWSGKKVNSIAKRSHNNNQLQSFVSVLSVAKSAFGGWLKFVSICVISWLKNKPKSQVNLTILLTNIYEDQQKPEKKQTQFVGQKPYF